MLPILIAMDMVGIRAWSGKADWRDLKVLIPGAIVGIVLGTLAFGVMSDQLVKGLIGLIAVGFTLDRLLRHRGQATTEQRPPRIFGWLSGVGAGFTSTLAHAGGPPVMIYLLSWRQPRETFVATTVFSFPSSTWRNCLLHRTRPVQHRHADNVRDTAAAGTSGRVDRHASLTRIPERPFYLFATALGLSGVKLLWDGLMA
jgi:uncharacterized membrane protein YfcA